jgi:hypothetical protein
VTEARCEILDLLSQGLDAKVNKKLNTLVDEFAELFEHSFFEVDDDKPDVLRKRPANRRPAQAQWNATDLKRLEAKLFDTTEELNSLVKLHSDEVVVLLYDLMRYQHSKLVTKAFLMLARRASARAYLAKYATEIQVLAHPEVIQAYFVVNAQLRQMWRSIRLLSSTDREMRINAHRRCQASLTQLQAFCTTGSAIEMVTGDTLVMSAGAVVNCQAMLRNMGLHKLIIEIISMADAPSLLVSQPDEQPVEPTSSSEPSVASTGDHSRAHTCTCAHTHPRSRLAGAVELSDLEAVEEHKALIRECYRCLEAFCRSSPSNQLLVHKNLALFTKHIGHGLNAGDAIAACVENNQTILSRLSGRFTDDLITTILQRCVRVCWCVRVRVRV